MAWGNHSVPVPGAAVERKSLTTPVLPNQIVAPTPEVDQTSRRNLRGMEQGIVAPPPNVQSGVRAVASLAIDVVAPAPDASAAGSRRGLRGLESAVVAPPPATDAASIRRLGDLNIGRSDVIVPAPQLPVASQRTLSGFGGEGKAIVPPPPSVESAASGVRLGHGRTRDKFRSAGRASRAATTSGRRTAFRRGWRTRHCAWPSSVGDASGSAACWQSTWNVCRVARRKGGSRRNAGHSRRQRGDGRTWRREEWTFGRDGNGHLDRRSAVRPARRQRREAGDGCDWWRRSDDEWFVCQRRDCW